MNYTETTLDQFKDAAEGHIAGRKTGVTMTYKGLSAFDRGAARRWMRVQRAHCSSQAKIARLNLNTERAEMMRAQAIMWDKLSIRLLEELF